MSAAGAQTDKMSVVMRFISSQVSKMSSQAGFWACFSQFSSLASGLRVISASPSPGRALYKGVILPGKKNNHSAMSRWRPRSCYRESRRWTPSRHKKMAENLFEMCNSVDVSALAGLTATAPKLQWMPRRFPISHRNEIDATYLSFDHMTPRSVFTQITWF